MTDTSANRPRSLFQLAKVANLFSSSREVTGFTNEEAFKNASLDDKIQFIDELSRAVESDPRLKAEVARAWLREIDELGIKEPLRRLETQSKTILTNRIMDIEGRLEIPTDQRQFRATTPRRAAPKPERVSPDELRSRIKGIGNEPPEKPQKAAKTTLAEGMKSALQAARSAPGAAYRTTKNAVSAIPRVISKGVKTAKRAITGGPDYTKYDAKKLIQLLTHSTPGSDRADKVIKAIEAKVKAASTDPGKQAALRNDFKTEKFSKGGLGSGETILTAAARYGHQNVVDTLLKYEDVLQVKGTPRTSKGKQHSAAEYIDSEGKISVPPKQRKFYNSEKLAAAAVVGGAIGASGGLAAAPVLAVVGVHGGMPAIAPLISAAAAKLGAVTGITGAAHAIAAGGASTLSSAGMTGLVSQIGSATGITGVAHTIAAGGASTLSSAGMTSLVSQIGSATGITGAINTTASFLSSLATSAGAHTLGYVGVGATGQAIGGAAMVGAAGGLATAGALIATDKTIRAAKGNRSQSSSQPETAEVETPLQANGKNEPEIIVLAQKEVGKFQNDDGGPTVLQETSSSGKVKFTFENIPDGKKATISTPRLGEDGEPISPPILEILSFDHKGALASREYAEFGKDGELVTLKKHDIRILSSQSAYDQGWLEPLERAQQSKLRTGEILPDPNSILAAAKAHANYSAGGIGSPSVAMAAVPKRSERGMA